ncbi:MAG: ABC transporter ATP-binding protein [Chloroflexi bacterium]|nr:ABC transporter ATP-binding protein [Chloroflexota bacterium]
MSILLRLLGYSKKYWPWAALTFLCLILSAALAMATPWLIKEVIDVGVARRDKGFLVIASLALIAVSLFRGGFGYGQQYLGEFLSQRVAYDLRNTIYDRLQRQSFAYHDQAQTGQLMSRATVDVEAVRWFVALSSLRFLYLIILFFATAFILINFNWRLALVSFGCLPLVGFRAVTVNLRLRPIWLRIQQRIADLGVVLQENLSGVRVVKAFAQEDQERAKFAAPAQDVHDQSLMATRHQSFNMPLMSFLLTMATAIILWYGGREVVAGRLSLGELVAFNGYLLTLAMPVRMVGFMVNIAARAIPAGQRIFEVLDAESAVKESPHAKELRGIKGNLRFERVTFSYNSGSPTLQEVDFEARPGEMIALVGETGSGKSTIANLIPRFYDVTAGRITLDGIDIRDVTLTSLRRQIGIVQQDVFLFTATIRDNIAYGAIDAPQEAIMTAAKAAQIQDFIQSLPQGYDTWVGERGLTLSGGQKQRIAIARTLLLNPPILILDDSTSSVDVDTEERLQQALEKLTQGRTTIVIAHRLRTLKRAHQILVLRNGRIVEKGDHYRLLAQGGFYRQIYELQLRPQEEF